MPLMLKPYKGYHAYAHNLDVDTNLIAGCVACLVQDTVTFYASNPADLQREFEASLDAYLAACAENGPPPEVPADFLPHDPGAEVERLKGLIDDHYEAKLASGDIYDKVLWAGGRDA